MRKTYYTILKKYFCNKLIQSRISEGFTQANMAKLLCIDERSYINLEHGKSGSSAVTLALFLVYVCKDVPKFIEDLRHAFESAEEWVA